MSKNYKQLKMWIGNIDEAVSELKECQDRGILATITFNGVKLYSDIDDIDSAYKKVTGKTKSEFDSVIRTDTEKYEKELEEHKEKIPQLTKEWIEKGNKILYEKYHETWAKCVPIRLGDLYRGMELGCCLDIVDKLNSGCSMFEAKEIIDSQYHSGMSYSLVCAMVKSFCDRGIEFVNFAKL